MKKRFRKDTDKTKELRNSRWVYSVRVDPEKRGEKVLKMGKRV